MFARDRVAPAQDLRLHRSRDVHQINSTPARLRLVRNFRGLWLLPGPRSKRLLDRLQHRGRVEIADQQEQSILWRVKILINLKQICSLIRRNLSLCSRRNGIRMIPKQNFPQPFAGQKPRLRSIQLHFLQLQSPLTFKFRIHKRRIARQLIHQPEQRLAHLRQSRKRNGARIRARARRQIRAQTPQILFNPPADPQLGPRAYDRRRHLSQTRAALDRRRVSRPKRKLPMKFRYRVRLRQQNLKPVRQTHARPLRPSHRSFRSKRRDRRSRTPDARLSRHYAASFSLLFTGVRNTIARFSARKYFFATACTSSLFTAKNPSKIEFTISGLLSNSVKHASRCISP